MTRSIAEALSHEDSLHRARRWAAEWRQFAALPFVASQSERLGQLYDIVGTANLFGEESLFINLGYWKNRPSTLDEASADLARLVAREAELGPSDVVIDVGCGYGDQDFLWAKEFEPHQIVGVNIAAEQIGIANCRAAEFGVDDTVEFVRGSAMDLPRADASATKVTALESAFHFPSHTRFFAEAYRILQPGGKLVTADIIPRTNPIVTRVGQLPGFLSSGDMLDANRYRSALLDAGFATARVYSIRSQVYAPLARFLRGRLRHRDMRRVNPALRVLFSRSAVELWSPWMDYVIAVATKGER